MNTTNAAIDTVPRQYFRIPALVREVYPECEYEHGRWIGPDYAAAESLDARLESTLDALIGFKGWGPVFPRVAGRKALRAVVKAAKAEAAR